MKARVGGGISEYDVPMVDKAVDSGWKKESLGKRLPSVTGLAHYRVVELADNGVHPSYYFLTLTYRQNLLIMSRDISRI